jgi:hypothetical protein
MRKAIVLAAAVLPALFLACATARPAVPSVPESRANDVGLLEVVYPPDTVRGSRMTHVDVLARSYSRDLQPVYVSFRVFIHGTWVHSSTGSWMMAGFGQDKWSFPFQPTDYVDSATFVFTKRPDSNSANDLVAKTVYFEPDTYPGGREPLRYGW